MRLRRLASARFLARAAIAPVAVVGVIAVAGCGGEDRGSADGADAEAAQEDPAPDAPRTYVEAGCEEALAAAARERWPEGERSGAGSDEAALLEVQQDELGGEASKRWPDEFAGAWGDGGETDRFYIGFTAGAEEKVGELREGSACPQLLVAVDREHSIDDLTALQREMRRDRDRARDEDGVVDPTRSPGGHHGTDIDPARGVVIAFVEEATPEAIAELEERYGAQVVVEEAGRPKPANGFDQTR